MDAQRQEGSPSRTDEKKVSRQNSPKPAEPSNIKLESQLLSGSAAASLPTDVSQAASTQALFSTQALT